MAGFRDMRLDDFAFELPRELIADHPAEPRDAARLLVLPAGGGLLDRRIADLPELLRPGDLLVFNDTKVIPARLVGTTRAGDGRDHAGDARRAAAPGAPMPKGRGGCGPATVSSSAVTPRGFRGRDRREKPRGRGGAALRPRRRGVPRGAGALRRDAAAALYQARAGRGRRCARPRRLSDDVRPRRGRRRRADRRAAFHAGSARPARGARHRMGHA